MSGRHFTTQRSVDCCVETPLVDISTVAAAATSLPMGAQEDVGLLDPAQWSPYRVRRSSYVIATQDAAGGGSRQPPRPSSEIGQTVTRSEFVPLGPRNRPIQSPIYDGRPETTFSRDLDLPALLPRP